MDKRQPPPLAFHLPLAGQHFIGTPNFRTELIVRRPLKRGYRGPKLSFCSAGGKVRLADE